MEGKRQKIIHTHSSTNNNNTIFQSLSTGILQYIFSYLEKPKGLASVALTAKRFRSFFDEDDYWKNLVQREISREFQPKNGQKFKDYYKVAHNLLLLSKKNLSSKDASGLIMKAASSGYEIILSQLLNKYHSQTIIKLN